MVLACSAKCAKYTLFIFNIIFWLSGFIFIAAGAYIAIDKDLKFLDDILAAGDNDLKIAAYVAIVIGVFTLIVGFCGCCGAIKENRCLLGTYITLLSIILLVSLTIGIYAAVKKKDIIKKFKERTKEIIQNKYPVKDAKTGENFKRVIDAVQLNGKCCGVEDKNEWEKSKWYTSQSDPKYPFPPSCCGSKSGNYSIIKKCNTDTKYYKEKCINYIEYLITSNAPLIIGIACSVAVLEIFGILFACCLCRSIGLGTTEIETQSFYPTD